MKKLVIGVALISLLAMPVLACWFTAENFNKCYIAQINNADCFYEDAVFDSGGVAHPEAGTISFPATVWIKLQPRDSGPAVTQMKLQFRKSTDSTWTDIKTISNVAWAVNFEKPVALFGRNCLNNLPGVSGGDEILVRIYVTDGLYENADIGVDTTEDGANGWQDQWVVKLTVSNNTRPQ